MEFNNELEQLLFCYLNVYWKDPKLTHLYFYKKGDYPFSGLVVEPKEIFHKENCHDRDSDFNRIQEVYNPNEHEVVFGSNELSSTKPGHWKREVIMDVPISKLYLDRSQVNMSEYLLFSMMTSLIVGTEYVSNTQKRVSLRLLRNQIYNMNLPDKNYLITKIRGVFVRDYERRKDAKNWIKRTYVDPLRDKYTIGKDTSVIFAKFNYTED